jgi:hypothetical protein
MAKRDRQRDDEHEEVELDLVGHRGDTEPSDEARRDQKDVPTDVEEWRDRDRERGVGEDEYVEDDVE